MFLPSRLVVLFLARKGDCYQYLTEFKSGEAKEEVCWSLDEGKLGKWLVIHLFPFLSNQAFGEAISELEHS